MSAIRYAALGLALAALVAVGAGCGGDDDDGEEAAPPATVTEEQTETAPAGEAVAVELDEYSFDPSEVEVQRGSTISAENIGELPHNLTIERGTNPREPSQELAATSTFDAGQSGELEVELEPGSYSMVCTVPGHREQGMVGTITVE